MRDLPELPAGVYRHYKGPLYLVLGYGRDANVEGRRVVVYVGLQLDGARPGARINVRTAEEFHDRVNPETGGTVIAWAGVGPPPVPRFTYLGPEFSPDFRSV